VAAKAEDWKAITPETLVTPIEHVRGIFEKGVWKCSQITEKLCFADLHPEDRYEDLSPYKSEFPTYQKIIGVMAARQFQRDRQLGTPPAIFQAFRQAYSAGIRSETSRLFNDVLQIAIAHSGSLREGPVEWAKTHLRMLLEAQKHGVRAWIKSVCDRQGPLEVAESFEEYIFWKDWRAPKLIYMQPSGNLPYDARAVWAREDEVRTEQLLSGLSERFIQFLGFDLDELAGNAHVELAKTGGVTRRKIVKEDDELLHVHDKPSQDDAGTASGPSVETENPSHTVFISYSHKEPDPEWLERVRDHLHPLERRGLKVTIWDDSCIHAGTKWQTEIENALRKARIALLLVTAKFFASDYIWTNELPPLLYAAENHGTVVLPLIVSASRFSREPQLSRYQAINNPAKPLDRLEPGEQEQVLDDMVRRIEALIFAPVNHAGSTTMPKSTESLGPASSADQVSADVAAALIRKHAKCAGVKVGITVKAPVSPFETSSYRAIVNDEKGVIYCHADGHYRGTTFYVRKGIGWFYERVLLGVSSRLGLPITDEEVADGTGYPTSRFEGGYIEWSPKTKVARAVIRSTAGDQTLAERLLL
jgi:TIR domain/LGFP repeat